MNKSVLNRQQAHSTGGFVLVAMMIIMLVIGILANGAMTRGRLLSVYAVRLTVDAQREWDAQTGLERAAGRFIENDALTGFDYSEKGVSVLVDHVGANNYRVKSTCVRGGEESVLQQNYFVKYATVTNSPFVLKDIHIGMDPSDAGTNVVVTLGSGAVLTGIDADSEMLVIGSLQADGTLNLNNMIATLSGESNVSDPNIQTYQTINIPDAQAVIDAIKTVLIGYDTTISNGGTTYNLPTKGNSAPTIALNGKTQVVNGSGNVELSKGATVTGNEGTLIIKGDLTLKKPFDIGNNKLLIEGNLILEPGAELIGSGLVYVKQSVDGEQNANNVEIDLGGGLLVGGGFDSKNNMSLDGFMYVDGNLAVKNNLTVEGMIMASSLTIRQNSEINLTKKEIPAWLIQIIADLSLSPSITVSTTDIAYIVRSDWTKIK